MHRFRFAPNGLDLPYRRQSRLLLRKVTLGLWMSPAKVHAATIAAAIAIVTTATAPTHLFAQAIDEKVMGKPTAVLKDGLKSVHAIRELADGRVLVVDSVGEKMLVADFTTGKTETRMSGGTGADDFRALGKLWAWTSDSAAVADVGKGQLHILAADGSRARSMRLSLGAGSGPPRPVPSSAAAGGQGAGRGGATASGAASGRGGMRAPSFTALVGRVWLFGSGVPARPAVQSTALQPPRSLYPILKLSLQSMKLDTVAQLMTSQQPRAPQMSTSSGNFSVYVGTAPVQLLDNWTTLSDGTVVVVRAAPYRVDHYGMDGSRLQLNPIKTPEIPITASDRKRIVEDYKQIAANVIKNDPRRTSILAVAYEEPRSWPATHPPFRGDIAPVVDELDQVWLMTRCISDEQSVCYDVIDRNGARVQRYRFPEKSVVVGFGNNTVYTAVEQKSDKSVLQRYDLK